jgi:hypothetical protein
MKISERKKKEEDFSKDNIFSSVIYLHIFAKIFSRINIGPVAESIFNG